MLTAGSAAYKETRIFFPYKRVAGRVRVRGRVVPWQVRVGEKPIRLYINVLQIAISIVVPTFLSSYNLTGGSGVRGKADPNWV
jgi:hypothetical protein